MVNQGNIQAITSIEGQRYCKIDLDHLVMYAVAQLEKLGLDLSFENAVVAAFRLFPKKFSLLGFPEFPDAKRVHHCLRRCTFKSKQWLGGRISQGFVVTDKSRAIFRETENLLFGQSEAKLGATSQTRRQEVILAELESSPAYAKYASGHMDLVTEADLCFMLEGTLDSSRDLLRRNLEQIRVFARQLGRADILVFLEHLEQRFKAYLASKSAQKGDGAWNEESSR